MRCTTFICIIFSSFVMQGCTLLVLAMSQTGTSLCLSQTISHVVEINTNAKISDDVDKALAKKNISIIDIEEFRGIIVDDENYAYLCYVQQTKDGTLIKYYNKVEKRKAGSFEIKGNSNITKFLSSKNFNFSSEISNSEFWRGKMRLKEDDQEVYFSAKQNKKTLFINYNTHQHSLDWGKISQLSISIPLDIPLLPFYVFYGIIALSTQPKIFEHNKIALP